MEKPKKSKLCACGKLARANYDINLYCGDEQCDECFKKTINREEENE